jgi:hypothetical protein
VCLVLRGLTRSFQIQCTADKVYATNFLELGNIVEFDEFKEEIPKKIEQRHQYSYNFKCDNDFVLNLITSDLILDIKEFYS